MKSGMFSDLEIGKEGAAAESERFRLFADTLPTLAWVADADGSITWYNRRWHDYCGSTPEEMAGWGWQSVHDPEMLPVVMERWTGSIATGTDFEMTFPLRGADGVYRPFLTRVAPLRNLAGTVVQWFGTNTDVSPQREAELALDAARAAAEAKASEMSALAGRLAQSEARLQAIVEAAPIGLVFADAPSGLITGGNAMAERICGHPILTSADIEHYDEWRGFHLDGRPVAPHEYPLARAIQGEERPKLEVLYQRGDGRRAYICFVGSPIRNAGGDIIGGVVASLDVDRERRTGRRQGFLIDLADQLRGYNDPREIVECAAALLGKHLGVSRVGFGEMEADDGTMRFETDYVDGVSHLVGSFPVVSFGAGNFDDLRRGLTTRYADVTVEPRTRKARFAEIDARAAMAVPLIRDGKLRAILYAHHCAVREWHDDEIALVEDVAARTWDALERARAEAELRAMNATLEDRVEQRSAALAQVEASLRQAQKIESIGQLTGGIAHDFNNMLSIVIGSLDMVKRRLSTDPARALAGIEQAEEGAQRAAQLTARLLAFSRQQPLAPEVLDPNKLVANMSELLRRTIGETIKIETVLAGGLWPTLIDPGQLENAIVNLCVNARDAMPDGGRLTIETANTHLDDVYAALHAGVEPGQYVVIAVTDTGTGMPPHVIERAFDPFYTTKGVGQGTGLGLSQVHGFVKQSDGHVKIYSEQGAGTTIKLYLPRHFGAATERQRLADIFGDVPRARDGEAILVVEDEAAVRLMSVDVLESLGYAVVAAADGEQALDLLGRHPEITLLFTDIVMPGISGRVLADRATTQRPELKVLFTTGYTRNAVVHNGTLDPGVAFLPKPFTVDALARKVRAVFDNQGVNRPV